MGPSTAPPDRNYFEVVAVRAPIRSAAHRSFARTGMGRLLTWVELDAWIVATAHLESLKAGGPVRVEQAQHVLDALRAADKPVVFAGDTNLRDAEAAVLAFGDVVDAFEQVGSPADARATYGARARYDRAWVRGLRVERFETFDAVALHGVSCSDHRGIRVTIGW